MTTTTILQTDSNPSSGALQRIARVARLHWVNKGQIVVVPWMIMGFIFAANLAIAGIIRVALSPKDLAEGNSGFQFSGATTFFFIYMMIVAIMAINKTFPFAQGYSVTRRDFYLGSSLAFLGLAAGYAAALTLLGWIEVATQGWGLHFTLFAPVYFGADPLQQLYVNFLLFLFFFFVGAATASVYVRWALNGMLVFFGTLVLILLGAVALITFSNGWGGVGAWFVSMGVLGVASWTLVPTAIAAIAGYFLLQGATPRN
jgi:hypothetical protein